MDSAVTTPIYEQYLDALLAGDRSLCSQTVADLSAAGVDLKDLYVHLFQRALYRVGELWEQQRISVAVEHLASAITERLLTEVQPQVFGGPARRQSVIISCVADEYHQLGGRMIADFCEMRGWRGYFLGANTPLPDLLQLIAEKRPTLIGLSLSIYSNLPALLNALGTIRQAHPHLPVLVGGQAFRWGGVSAIQAYANVAYVASLDDLEMQLALHEM